MCEGRGSSHGVAGAARRRGGAMAQLGFGASRTCRRRGVARRVAPATPPLAAVVGAAGRIPVGTLTPPGTTGGARTSPGTTDAAPPPVADGAASVSNLWSQLVVLGHGGSALGLAQTSPDSVRLTDAQCVVETRLAHRACGANGFGLFFSSQLLALALEVRRWKEDSSLRTAACSSHLPVFLDALCTHRHTPLPRRTIQPVRTRDKEKL